MLTSLNVYTTSNVTLRFAPLATGPNFGSSDSIGSLKGQSEMTLNGMSSEVNSLDLILMRLVAAWDRTCDLLFPGAGTLQTELPGPVLRK